MAENTDPSKTRKVAETRLAEVLKGARRWSTGGHLDSSEKNRLIAHGRQDGAHALLNTITLLEEMRKLKRAIFDNRFLGSRRTPPLLILCGDGRSGQMFAGV
jgi:hypothetical protein